MTDYLTISGKPVAILYRRSPIGQTEPCPFCTQSHSHEEGDGLRKPHCKPYWNKGLTHPKEQITAGDGQILSKADGYFIRCDPGLVGSIFEVK